MSTRTKSKYLATDHIRARLGDPDALRLDELLQFLLLGPFHIAISNRCIDQKKVFIVVDVVTCRCH